MPLVPRSFPPSKLRRKSGLKEGRKRHEHINIVGGREGPEVSSEAQRAAKGKPPMRRTVRFVPAGSERWTKQLSEGATPEGTRTQSQFLRDVFPSLRAYARGLMTVTALLSASREALQRRPDDAQIELTVLSGDGRVVAVSGRLVDPDVDTLANDGTDRWVRSLSRLADELQAARAEFDVGGLNIERYRAVPRVYLVYKDQVIPVEQLVVGPAQERPGLQKFMVRGLYLPAPDDPIVRVGRGEKRDLVPGTPVQLPAADISSVSVDPPLFRGEEFANTLAFARSRGLVIEPTENPYGLPAGQAVTFPYSLILRLREIHPPAEDYDRVSSRPVETVKTTERDFAAASAHLQTLTEAAVREARAGRPDRKRDREYSLIDPVTQFAFRLRGTGLESTRNPVLLWATPTLPAEPRTTSGSKTKRQYEADMKRYNAQRVAIDDVRGLPVTPVDFLRVIRAIGMIDVLKELRNRYRYR